MRQALAILLVVLLCVPAYAQVRRPSVKEQTLTITRDAAVEVRFADGSKQRGRLGAVNDAGFELQTERHGKIATEMVGFERVKWVKQLSHDSTGRSIGRTILITGIVVGTVFGVIFLIGALVNAVD